MEITREDDKFLVLEAPPVTSRLGMGILLGVGALLSVLFYLAGATPGTAANPLLVTLLVAGVFYFKAPHVTVYFNRKKRSFLHRRKWIWGTKDETYRLTDLKGLAVHQVITRHAPRYRAVLELNGKEDLYLHTRPLRDEDPVVALAERIRVFLEKPTSRQTGELRSFPVAHKTPVITAKGMRHFLIGGTAVVALMGYIGYGEWQQHELEQTLIQAERDRRERRLARESADKAKLEKIIRTANTGDGPAMARLAQMYGKGVGTKAMAEKALYWAKKGAAKGESDAYTIMAHLTKNGANGPKSMQGALDWYMKAAEKGSAEGLYGLSTVYYFNDGFPQDLAKAHAYMVLSARGKFFNSANAVDIIGNKLTTAQKAQSRKVVEEWDRKHPGLVIKK